MPFRRVDTKVDFPAMERDVLAFWERTEAFEKLRSMNRGKPKWSFLDGPITANNPMGVHHAWGRTYKDVFNRYFAATGHDLRYQNGFDCQGLWVEVEVERQLNLTTKQEIEEIGLETFTETCKERVKKYAAIQTEQSKRLGYWMDWTDSYFTMSEENNYTIWSFLKKCHESGHLYKGTDVMPWSGRAGCAYSHMEIAEGRRLTTHTAVFARFPIRGREKEYLLVWTTTPWTLSANTGCAVNGELDYVQLRSKKDGCLYYFAKENLNFKRLEKEFKEGFGLGPWPKDVPKLKTLHQMFNEQGGYEIEGTVKGREMVGWTYDGPFDDLEAQQRAGGFAEPMDILEPGQREWLAGREGHRVFDPGKTTKGEAFVVAGEGTGIVHSAPGCGDVDHIWGVKEELVAIAPLNGDGRFIEGFGPLTGHRATDPETVKLILSILKEKGFLFATETYPHVYPHCWRTGDELVFRLVSEWYISMDWREEIKDVTRQVNWLPANMYGQERELDWLTTMKDWMISKKRYWGLALPIWECNKCSHFEVIGSREELQERAVAGWSEFEGHTPHRPYVDRVFITCEKCGNDRMQRIPDVGNPWLDAGIVAYSTTKYNTDPEYWDEWIPADLITECFPGQFRNWFYAILAMSTMMEMGKEKRRPPFKNVLGHALVLNEERRPMHKSDGTAIWFEEAAEQIGVDVMRWMYCSQTPTTDLPFGTRHPNEPISIDLRDGTTLDQTVSGEQMCKVTSGPADETRRRVLLPLWNTYAFFCNYANLDGFDPSVPELPLSERQDIDRWILSDLQLLIRASRSHFERYDLPPITQEVERFLDNLSAWYVRRNRRRFWRGASEGDNDKLAAYQTLYEVLTSLIKVIAPIVPFIAEDMYQNLVVGSVDGAPESIHHVPYPDVDESRIDADLSNEMSALRAIVSMARAARKQSKLKVRQPLAELKVAAGSDIDRRAVERFPDQILEELNVKQVNLLDDATSLVTTNAEANMKTLGPKVGKNSGKVRTMLAEMDGLEVAETLAAGKSVHLDLDGSHVSLEREDVNIVRRYHDDWAGEDNGETMVLLDKRLTPSLHREGVARDLVHSIQNLRKEAGLDIADHISLAVVGDSELIRETLNEFGEYLRGETLADELQSEPMADAAEADVKFDDESVRIQLRRFATTSS